MEDLLDALLAGRIDRASFLARARSRGLLELADLARFDSGRRARTGIPEIVLAEGKSDSDLERIVEELLAAGERVLVSRLKPSRLEALRARFPESVAGGAAEGGLLVLSDGAGPSAPTGGRVAILTGGTADLAVAREAAAVAEELGATARIWADRGVAGLHRLLEALAEAALFDPHVYVAAAGREGALASVVAGLVDRPVIGLPVSVGYGRGAAGEAALNAMLQSCAPLLVVNIDAGTVAGATAARIAALASRNEAKAGAASGSTDALAARGAAKAGAAAASADALAARGEAGADATQASAGRLATPRDGSGSLRAPASSTVPDARPSVPRERDPSLPRAREPPPAA